MRDLVVNPMETLGAWRATRYAALAALFALFALPVLLAPRNFPSDDALFYLQVARNIAAGHGSTFNTVLPTNGYHPLWILPCVAAAWVSRGDPTLMLRVTFAIQMLLTVGALLLFRTVARRLGLRSWPLGIPMLATFFLTGMYGSEGHINGVCILASLLFLVRVHARPDPRDAIVLGVLLGLTMLARLDNVFLVAAMLAGLTFSLPKGDRPRRTTVARIATAGAAVVAPYLIWNLVTFGSFVPISGAIKSTFPHVVGDARNLGALGLATFVFAAAGAAWSLFGRQGSGRRLAFGAMAAGVLAQDLYIVLYTNHNTHWAWYYVSGSLLATLLLCAAADVAMQRGAWLRRRGVAVAAAASHNQFIVEYLPRSTDERWEIQFAQYMDRTLPAGAGVLVFDYPGHLAFYSSLRIVAADGLMGDFRYDADLRRRGLRRVLLDHAIEYYIGRDLAPADSCRTETIFAPVERIDVGALVLCPGNRLAATPAVVRGVPEPDLGLFRIGEITAPRGTPPPAKVKHGTLW